MENLVGSGSPGKGDQEQGKVVVLLTSVLDRRVVVIFLTLIMSKPRLTRPLDICSAGVLRGRWRITAFTGFFDFGN
jgi:hypothetical protein